MLKECEIFGYSFISLILDNYRLSFGFSSDKDLLNLSNELIIFVAKMKLLRKSTNNLYRILWYLPKIISQGFLLNQKFSESYRKLTISFAENNLSQVLMKAFSRVLSFPEFFENFGTSDKRLLVSHLDFYFQFWFYSGVGCKRSYGDQIQAYRKIYEDRKATQASDFYIKQMWSGTDMGNGEFIL